LDHCSPNSKTQSLAKRYVMAYAGDFGLSLSVSYADLLLCRLQICKNHNDYLSEASFPSYFELMQRQIDQRVNWFVRR